MEIVEILIKAGFTRHESLLYLTLCQEGELTGYEAAKISGISRSNAYLALAGLVEKGAAWKIDGEIVRYTPVPPQELCLNLKREYQQLLDYIEAHAPQLKQESDPFITISGDIQVRHKVKNIINEAEKRIYLSLSNTELKLVYEELQAAVSRGLKVVLITDQLIQMGTATVYLTNKTPGQIRLIADSTVVLTGEWVSNLKANCIYSKNQILVALIKDSLTNEIELLGRKG